MFYQLKLNLFNNNYWIVTDKGDQTCRQLADRHYNRQTIGAPLFTRPGHNLVLRNADGTAVIVFWKGIRDDNLDCWEITLFRNESNELSSKLINEAIKTVLNEWGKPPKEGIITFVDQHKIKSKNPGYCFKVCGFKQIGLTKINNLVILQYKDVK